MCGVVRCLVFSSSVMYICMWRGEMSCVVKCDEISVIPMLDKPGKCELQYLYLHWSCHYTSGIIRGHNTLLFISVSRGQ